MVVRTEIVNFRQRVIPIPAQSTGENNIPPSSKRLLVKFIVMTSFTHHLWPTVFRALLFARNPASPFSASATFEIRPVFFPRVLMPPTFFFSTTIDSIMKSLPPPLFLCRHFAVITMRKKEKKKERNENYRESGARYAFLLINLSRTDVTEAACLTEFTRKEEDNANEPLISISRKLEERSVVQHASPRLTFLNYHRSIMQHCDSPIFEWNFSTIRVGVSRCKDIRLFSSILLVYTYGKCVSTWPRYGLSRDYFREKQSVGTRTRLDN